MVLPSCSSQYPPSPAPTLHLRQLVLGLSTSRILRCHDPGHELMKGRAMCEHVASFSASDSLSPRRWPVPHTKKPNAKIPTFVVRISTLTRYPFCRWSVGSVLFLISWAVLMGPWSYAKHLISGSRLPFTAAYFGSIALTLYFAIGVSALSPWSIYRPPPFYFSILLRRLPGFGCTELSGKKKGHLAFLRSIWPCDMTRLVMPQCVQKSSARLWSISPCTLLETRVTTELCNRVH